MSPAWIKTLASSKDVAFLLSLIFNMVALGAIWRLWKSREVYQDKVTSMLTDLVRELSRMIDRQINRES